MNLVQQEKEQKRYNTLDRQERKGFVSCKSPKAKSSAELVFTCQNDRNKEQFHLLFSPKTRLGVLFAARTPNPPPPSDST